MKQLVIHFQSMPVSLLQLSWHYSHYLQSQQKGGGGGGGGGEITQTHVHQQTSWKYLVTIKDSLQCVFSGGLARYAKTFTHVYQIR